MPIDPSLREVIIDGITVEMEGVRVWGDQVEAAVLDQQQSVSLAYNTLAQLNANTTAPPGSRAEVLNDPVPANNGIYSKNTGAGWTKIADLPVEPEDTGREVTVGDTRDEGDRFVFGVRVPAAGGKWWIVQALDAFTGRWRILLDTLSAEDVRSEGTGGPWEPIARDRGARRNCWSFREAPDYVRFDSDGNGPAYPYIFRKLYPHGAIMLDANGTIEGHGGIGQSWRSLTSSLALGTTAATTDPSLAELPVDWAEPGIALSLSHYDGPIATIATQAEATGIVDYASVVTALGPQADYAAASALARFRARHGYRVAPIGIWVQAFPGQPWPALGPGGSVDTDADGQPNWFPWEAGLDFIQRLIEIAPSYNKDVQVAAIAQTLGGGVDTAAHREEMRNAFRALNSDPIYAGHGFNTCQFFVEVASQNARVQEVTIGDWDDVLFGENHGDVHTVGPRYAFPLVDNIHQNGKSILRCAEIEAYVKHLVLDRNMQGWRPLQMSSVVATAGSTTVLVNLVGGPPGNAGALVVDEVTCPPATETFHLFADNAKTTPYYRRRGYVVKVNGVPRDITSVTVTGTRQVSIVLASAPTAGQTVEVFYAWYGPGLAIYLTLADLNEPASINAWHAGAIGVVFNDGPNTGMYVKVGEDGGSWSFTGPIVRPFHTSCRGNIKVVGPDSVFWPGESTVDFWQVTQTLSDAA